MHILAVIGGIGFILVWLGLNAVWAVMSFMGGVMANDSGRLPAGQHMLGLVLLFVGELLVAASGIPAGLAFFWATHRSLLLWLFGGGLVVGAALQAGALWIMTHPPS